MPAPSRPDWGSVPVPPDRPPVALDATEPSAAPVAGRLAVVAPAGLRRPLADALRERRGGVVARERRRDGASDDPYDVRGVVADADPDAVLLVVPGDERLADVVPAPVVDGVPVGLLPAARPGAVAGWRSTVAGGPRPAAAWGVLAMATERYLGAAGDLYARLAAADGAGPPVYDWRASRIDRVRLCEWLATGPSLCVYVGHGRPRGWGGYQGCDWADVARVDRRRPAGAVVALACGTLGDGDGPPFGVRLVRRGRALSYLGCPGDVAVEDVVALAEALGAALADDPPATVGDLLVALDARVGGEPGAALRTFRLVGLPDQPLR
jgi:hypothetical protein